jgi:hypothetical protein
VVPALWCCLLGARHQVWTALHVGYFCSLTFWWALSLLFLQVLLELWNRICDRHKWIVNKDHQKQMLFLDFTVVGDAPSGSVFDYRQISGY